MNIRSYFGTFVIILLCNIRFGSTLYCYTCTQHKGMPCDVDVESVQQIQCAEGYSCITYIWTSPESSVVYRHCATKDRCEVLTANSTDSYTLEFCEVCSKDLCNASIVHGIPVSLVVITVLYFIANSVLH